ncbi:patatin-like phospholipase domain-containing protein 2 isoform X2 [Acropora millepora]|uniref:patatin-like phospholipase domain-containing protein 2 isoform X2 n=1 Tax=Acropora millepora TaxID=45264 RepID=UPI001CF49A51|nr:patatin-like phospholipase domain-containing protein 2 isoform X2 [Acropora millepora]
MEEQKDFNLTFSGCGFLGIYHIGVMSCLKENAVDFLKRVRCYGGASAGAFAAAGLVMDLSIQEVAEPVIRLTNRAKSLSFGPLHPSFQLVQAVRTAFQKMLPDNAHEIASGRLHISLTRVPDFTNLIVSEFSSKDDLIEALVATSFVPVYSGIFPSIFRGEYYVDGGISDNLPQHFTEGETITVSPFSGENDICPKDTSSNDIHIELRNTSMQLTFQNFYRFSRALFPPHQDILANICRQGYWDALRFLQERYPSLLTKQSLRSTPSMPPLDILQTNATFSCSEGACFTSNSQESSSMRSQIHTEGINDSGVCFCADMEEGESKLFKVLYEAFNTTMERELWSCYLIRRSLYVAKLLSKPCTITFHQFLVVLRLCLESLASMDKTGIKYIDKLLAMISMIVYTYGNKHQVQKGGRPSSQNSSDIPSSVNVSPSTDLYGKCGSEDGNLPSENTSSSTEPMEERYVLDFASNSDDLKNDEDKTRLHKLQEPAQKHIPGSILFAEQ